MIMAAVVAGCIGADPLDEEPAEDSPEFTNEVSSDRAPLPTEDLSDVIDEDHDGAPWLHAVPQLHEGSYGLDLVGYNPLTRPTENADKLGADSGYGAIDTWKNLVCIAHFAGSSGAMGGATIVDIEDPEDPIVLSSIESAAVNSDCQFTDDGQYLVLATYTGVTGSNPLPPPLHDAGAQGMSLYDVSDPADPQFRFHDSQDAGGSGYHNVFTAMINGTHYIFQTYTNKIYKINDDATGLEYVSDTEWSNHDLWVGKHPITKDWYIVTGGPEGGTAIININDPENPETEGIWETVGDRTAGWHRQWPLAETVDGVAYLIVAGEECGNGDSLPYSVLDWSDPMDPVYTGQWWIPGKPANEPPPHLCEMNAHEFEVFDGYVATGNYHAGIWLFDAGSPERAYEPTTVGYYLPSEIPQTESGTVNVPFVWSPDVWGAYFDERGYVIAADWHSGLYILEFHGTTGEWPEVSMYDCRIADEC